MYAEYMPFTLCSYTLSKMVMNKVIYAFSQENLAEKVLLQCELFIMRTGITTSINT